MAAQGQGHRRLPPFVLLHEPGEPEVAGGVAAYHQEVLAAVEVPAVFHGAGGAQGLLFHPVLHLHAETAAVAEMGHDIPGPVAHRGADLVEALRAQQLQYILHERPAQQGDHGLGTVSGNGLQPAAHASGHDHSFHKPPPFLSII